jgi:hypothetical protein
MAEVQRGTEGDDRLEGDAGNDLLSDFATWLCQPA